MHLHLLPPVVPDLAAHVLKFLSAFICVYIIRAIYCQVSLRFALRRVPGPHQIDLIWGEEWKLYHSEPGSLYVDWHKEFGKVVKYTGAFGVSITSISYVAGKFKF